LPAGEALERLDNLGGEAQFLKFARLGRGLPGGVEGQGQQAGGCGHRRLLPKEDKGMGLLPVEGVPIPEEPVWARGSRPISSRILAENCFKVKGLTR
jgi:hypothetical protein